MPSLIAGSGTLPRLARQDFATFSNILGAFLPVSVSSTVHFGIANMGRPKNLAQQIAALEEKAPQGMFCEIKSCIYH